MVGGGGTWRCPRCSPRTDDDPAATGDERLRVFLSYGHDGNEELVLRLKGFLEARGHEVWIDKDEIKGGDDWRRAIHDGIAASDQVLSVLSMYSVRDPGVCLNEIAIALSVRGGNISTVLVEPEDAVAVPPSVGHVQWLDMSQWRVRRDEPGFEEWLAGKLDELAEVVESEQSRRFAGEIDRLNRVLRPVLPHARTAALLDRFVGREWLADQVEVWRADPDSRALCLLGAPGVGKSAFTARLQHYWGDRVMAAHFCQWDKPEHRDAAVVVRSLAFQVACRLPQYRRRLLDLPQLDDLSGYTPADLFHLLLSDPLQVAIDGGQHHLILAVDAVDEARTPDGDNPLLRVLASNAAGLPRWVRVMLTARPDADVVPAVAHLSPVVIDTAQAENLADITAYLQGRLGAHLGVHPDPARVLQQIVDNSGGVFLYARYFCDAVDRGDLELDTSETFPRGLGGIYHQDLQRRFGPGGLEPDTVDYQAAAVVLAAAEPVPVDVLGGALGLTPKQLSGTLDRFGSHLVTDGGVARFTHKSVADYLTGRQAGGFWVESDDGQPLLAAHCRDLLLDGDPSTLPAYPLRWAAHHLRRAGRIDDAAAVQDRIQALLGDPAWVADTISRLGVDLVESMFNEHDPTSMLARMVRSHSHALRQQTGDPPGVLTTLTWAALRIDQTDLAANYRGIARAKHRPDAGPLALPEWTTERTDPRLIRTLTGHTDTVTSVAFGEVDGRTLLASGSNDKTVRLWNPATGQSIHNLTGHTGPVTSVAFGEIDGRTLLASGSSDKTIRVWDPITAQSMGNPFGYTCAVTAVAFGALPDGRSLLAAAGHDGSVRLWDLLKGEPYGEPLLVSNRGATCLIFMEERSELSIAAGGRDGSLRLWNLTLGERTPQVAEPSGYRYGPRGRGTDWDSVTMPDPSVMAITTLQDPATGHLLLIAALHEGATVTTDFRTLCEVMAPLCCHDGPATAVAATQSNGRPTVATAGTDRSVRLWAMEDAPRADSRPNTPSSTSRITCFTTSSCEGVDGPLIGGFNDGTVAVWDEAGWRRLCTHARDALEDGFYPPDINLAPPSITALGLTGSTHRGWAVASGSGQGVIRFWNARTGEPVNTPILVMHDGADPAVVRYLAVAQGNDGQTVIAYEDGEGWTRFGRLSGADFKVPATGPLALARTSEGICVLAAVAWPFESASIRLWNAETGEPWAGDSSFPHDSSVTSLSFFEHHDSLLLASGLANGTAVVWNVSNPGSKRVALTQCSDRAIVDLSVTSSRGRLVLGSVDSRGSVRLTSLPDGPRTDLSGLGADIAHSLMLNTLSSGGIELVVATGRSVHRCSVAIGGLDEARDQG